MNMHVLKDMNNKDRQDFYISIPIIIIALAFIIFYSFSMTPSEDDNMAFSMIKQNTMDIEKIVIAEEIYQPVTDIKIREQISTPSKIRAITPTVHSNNISNTITYANSSIANNDTKISSNNKQIQQTEINAANSLDSKIETDTVANKAAELANQPIEKNPVTNIQKTKDSNKDCIIIIGAYKRKSNIAALTDKLIKDGYDVFQTPYKGTTRVGIHHECNAVSLKATLINIRIKYADDAMVLEKS